MVSGPLSGFPYGGRPPALSAFRVPAQASNSQSPFSPLAPVNSSVVISVFSFQRFSLSPGHSVVSSRDSRTVAVRHGGRPPGLSTCPVRTFTLDSGCPTAHVIIPPKSMTTTSSPQSTTPPIPQPIRRNDMAPSMLPNKPSARLDTRLWVGCGLRETQPVPPAPGQNPVGRTDNKGAPCQRTSRTRYHDRVAIPGPRNSAPSRPRIARRQLASATEDRFNGQTLQRSYSELFGVIRSSKIKSSLPYLLHPSKK